MIRNNWRLENKFDDSEMLSAPTEWSHSCANFEPKLHQLSPYIGKLKSTIAEDLIKKYSCEGDTVLDPFSGSGTIPLCAAYLRRGVVAADVSQYSAILTRGKLFPPKNVDEALFRLRGRIRVKTPKLKSRILQTFRLLIPPNLEE